MNSRPVRTPSRCSGSANQCRQGVILSASAHSATSGTGMDKVDPQPAWSPERHAGNVRRCRSRELDSGPRIREDLPSQPKEPALPRFPSTAAAHDDIWRDQVELAAQPRCITTGNLLNPAMMFLFGDDGLGPSYRLRGFVRIPLCRATGGVGTPIARARAPGQRRKCPDVQGVAHVYDRTLLVLLKSKATKSG